jgi:hypothetical protein
MSPLASVTAPGVILSVLVLLMVAPIAWAAHRAWQEGFRAHPERQRRSLSLAALVWTSAPVGVAVVLLANDRIIAAAIVLALTLLAGGALIVNARR